MEPHPLLSLYKYCGRDVEASQQKRRMEFLQKQKNQRENAVDSSRNLSTLLDLEETDDEMECENQECQPRWQYKNRKCCLNFTLMKSEYLTEIPDDLEENWLVKFCPKGVRVLLVAKRFKTRLYTMEGYYVLTTKSYFPGGGFAYPNGVTILDCVYNREAKTIFVLDCLYWNNMSMIDSEVNFRFQWLHSKFEENPSIASNKRYQFQLIEFLPARSHLIENGMSMPEPNTSVHYYGITFYHKEGLYSFGYTPLVAWLWTYMLPEKMGIVVSKDNMIHMPQDYINMETYLENLTKKQKKKQKRPKKTTQKMDCN